MKADPRHRRAQVVGLHSHTVVRIGRDWRLYIGWWRRYQAGLPETVWVQHDPVRGGIVLVPGRFDNPPNGVAILRICQPDTPYPVLYFGGASKAQLELMSLRPGYWASVSYSPSEIVIRNLDGAQS